MIRQLDKWTTTAVVALLSSVGTARAYEHAEIGSCTNEPRVKIGSSGNRVGRVERPSRRFRLMG